MDDLRQSPNYARYMEKIGWKVEKLEIGNWKLEIYVRKLPLVGSIIKIQRPEKIPFEKIDNLAKKYRAIFVKIEPCNTEGTENLREHGFKLNKSPMLPTKTLQIDLTQSQEEIFKQMKKDCRYEIRKAEKNQVIVKGSDDIEAFIKMWHKNALRRGFWIPFGKEIRSIYEAFDKNAYLLLTLPAEALAQAGVSPVACHEPLAGASILIHDKVASYFHAASTPEGRKLSAPYLIVWEAIKLAKEKGCRIFDFEGIYDERFPIKSWKGFTHFKKSFGGKEIEYPGAFVKYRLPFL